MNGRSQELLTTAAKSLARVAPAGWTHAELKITGVGGMTKTRVQITRADGTIDTSVGLDEDGRTAARKLRKEMYQPAKGTWYNARLQLQPSGKLNADFDYDNPPFDGDVEADLLLEDERLFPRDAEHLPGWHPAASR